MSHDLAELDHRESNGVSVTLLWNRTTGAVLVRVVDEASDEDFDVDCEPDEALSAVRHPFAYAATTCSQWR